MFDYKISYSPPYLLQRNLDAIYVIMRCHSVKMFNLHSQENLNKNRDIINICHYEM